MADIYLYRDINTGKEYYYDGTKYIEYGSQSDNSYYDWSDHDEDAFSQEDEAEAERGDAIYDTQGRNITKMDPSDNEESSNKFDADKIFSDSKDELTKSLRQQQREKEMKKKAAVKKSDHFATSVQKLEFDINRLVKQEVAKVRKDTWAKYNAKTDGTYFKPGRRKVRQEGAKPSLYVFFDQSSSWSDADVQVGMQVLQGIQQKYVKSGLLDLKIFYFADDVHADAASARAEGSTSALPKILDLIRAYKPMNVLIMTDDDFDFFSRSQQLSSVIIPGGVFRVWKRSTSSVLMNVLKGKMLTKDYMIG